MAYLLVLLAVICTYMYVKYVEPRLDIYHEVFTHKKTADAMMHQIDSKRMICEFERHYPEVRKGYNDDMRIRGFQYEPEMYDDDMEFCDDECDCEEDEIEPENKIKSKKIGFLN